MAKKTTSVTWLLSAKDLELLPLALGITPFGLAALVGASLPSIIRWFSGEGPGSKPSDPEIRRKLESLHWAAKAGWNEAERKKLFENPTIYLMDVIDEMDENPEMLKRLSSGTYARLAAIRPEIKALYDLLSDIIEERFRIVLSPGVLWRIHMRLNPSDELPADNSAHVPDRAQ